ncbi:MULTISPECIES: GNAT family N-acetyltransferase [Rhizobium]|uniref:GNAT superfamily N-acetyltransferase n=1 Tax=Rhizobium paranaense TaxID=1650438 RepID=A0A7W8XTM9_9HYPH|nr:MULTISPECIES: GNAT family N-acetyltransferase [Rhizobium]MBB5575139.1 GNAT superfamily N-acetyltransferase [Rhizobium paranaense]PST64432.1 GNAT family N-acetyltransferase [Rhizobium sp. SEMIA4064]
MPKATIAILDNPSEEDHQAIVNPLLAFNNAQTGDDGYEQIAIMLKNEAGSAVGGLWAKLYYDWLFVELLFVPENLRGEDFGTKLLAQAEQIARQKTCVGIWLDTFSFQAPGFYEKNGYERFGTLEDYPKGRARIFFRKVF